MLRLNLLRVFHVVVQKQSVLKASEALFISQPAVSNALKKLQSDIEIRLFYKKGRALALTEHGQALYTMTTRLFGVEAEIEAFLEQIKSNAKQNIHLGLVTIYERFGIEEILQYFSSIDKSISVSIHSGNSKSIVEMLQNNRIDMGISGNVVQDANLQYMPYKRHKIFLVAPKGHKLYGNKTFTVDDIRDEPMVFKESGSSVRQTVDNFFGKYAVTPNSIMELSNLDSILNLVKREKCLTLLPDLSVQEKLGKDRSFSIAKSTDDSLAFNTYVVWHKEGMYAESTRNIIEQFCALANKA